MIFRQLYDNVSSTFTYLLADERTKEAIIIDTVYELFDRDLALIRELDLNLKYVLDTHCHADHITGAWRMKMKTGAKVGLAGIYGAENVDLPLKEGDVIRFGEYAIRVLATPGHTSGCLSFVTLDEANVFTGDCLMIRSAGRTDFQQGDSHKMFESIKKRLFCLPENCRVFPAHDYDGRCSSTIGEEKKFNTRIGGQASESDFVELMKNLNLPHPKKIKEALPANLRSGKPELALDEKRSWGAIEITYDGMAQVSADWVLGHLNEICLVDVREPSEGDEEYGYISGALKIPLRQLLEKIGELSKLKPIVTVCRSGKRSAQAVVLLEKNGFEKVASLKRGMIGWREVVPN